MTATTDDRFLDGRVLVRQLAEGFRGGLDAVMLAAAVPAQPRDETLELGAGAGTASLCLSARVPGASVTGIEIDPALVALANQNATDNNSGDRVRFVEGDVFALPQDLKRDFVHVFCNPPFHFAEGEISPVASRDRALRDTGRLSDWIEVGLKRTISDGTFTVILRAGRIAEAIARMPQHGLTIFPLWPRVGEPAKRVILQVRKGSRAETVMAPGLVLHEADSRYTRSAEAILRDATALAVWRA